MGTQFKTNAEIILSQSQSRVNVLMLMIVLGMNFCFICLNVLIDYNKLTIYIIALLSVFTNNVLFGMIIISLDGVCLSVTVPAKIFFSGCFFFIVVVLLLFY